jgi:hypothetical protein
MIPIKKWCAFKAMLPPCSEVAHRVIVVYKQETTMKYFYVTSQVEKIRKISKHDIGSVVSLSVSEWDVLTKDSCIQCDEAHLYELSEGDFKNVCESSEFEWIGEIPEKVKRAIIHAICASESFTEADKRAYTT